MDFQHIAITNLLKATPSVEGGRRYLFLEASNETLDVQGEVVLAKALEDSSGYYLKYGNLDLDHITQIGGKMGVPDYHFFEIGRPVQVEIARGKTFCKAIVYQGEGKSAERANDFWSSITTQDPPQQWFPSVGGAVIARDTELAKGGPRAIVKRVRWTNIGMSKTPVNPGVPAGSTVPIGAFAKSLTAEGHVDTGILAKMLTAGYGSDSASLAGGAALRTQSLDYGQAKEKIAGAIRRRKVAGGKATIAQYLMTQFKLSGALANEWAERFLTDFAHSIKSRSTR